MLEPQNDVIIEKVTIRVGAPVDTTPNVFQIKNSEKMKHANVLYTVVLTLLCRVAGFKLALFFSEFKLIFSLFWFSINKTGC